jgi:hypothetical protein
MQVVLKRAHNFESIHAGVEAKITEYASRGYRALGFGLAEGAGGPDAPGTHWEFLGLLPLFDPPRWVALLLLLGWGFAAAACCCLLPVLACFIA